MTLASPELSLRRLRGLHPDLVRVVQKAIAQSDVPILVVEGRRSVSRQRILVSRGASTTMNSRHLTGHAVDLVAVDPEAVKRGRVRNRDLRWGKPYHNDLARIVKRVAEEEGVRLNWGGDWQNFNDPPHYQLSWKSYPKQDMNWVQRTPDEVAEASIKATTKPIRKAPASTVTVLGAATTAVTGKAEEAGSFLMNIATQTSELAPIKTMLVELGANAYAITTGVFVLATGYVLKRTIVEEDDE